MKPTADKVALNKHCQNGEKERSSVKWEYITTFSDGEDQYKFHPKSEGEFKRYPKGTKKTLRVTSVGVSIEEK